MVCRRQLRETESVPERRRLGLHREDFDPGSVDREQPPHSRSLLPVGQGAPRYSACNNSDADIDQMCHSFSFVAGWMGGILMCDEPLRPWAKSSRSFGCYGVRSCPLMVAHSHTTKESHIL